MPDRVQQMVDGHVLQHLLDIADAATMWVFHRPPCDHPDFYDLRQQQHDRLRQALRRAGYTETTHGG